MEAEVHLQALLTSVLYGCKQLSLRQAKKPKISIGQEAGQVPEPDIDSPGKGKPLILLEIIPASLVIERTAQPQYQLRLTAP